MHDNKKSVFISHIEEEASIAELLKEWIELSFPESCSAFVSAHRDCLIPGKKWMEVIDEALRGATCTVVLCSPLSLQRPWINFEMGCSYMRKINIIPICHSGQTKGDLPKPISDFQAIQLESENFLEEFNNCLSKLMRITAYLPYTSNKKHMNVRLSKTLSGYSLYSFQNKPSIFFPWKDYSNQLISAMKALPPEATIEILQTWLPDNESFLDPLKDLFINYGKRFCLKVLLMDPDAIHLCKARVKHRRETPSKAKQNISDVIQDLFACKERIDIFLANANHPLLDLEIRIYDFMPFGPVYILGNHSMFFGSYLNDRSSVHGPMIVIKDSNSELWKQLKVHFDTGWAQAKKCDRASNKETSMIET